MANISYKQLYEEQRQIVIKLESQLRTEKYNNEKLVKDLKQRLSEFESLQKSQDMYKFFKLMFGAHLHRFFREEMLQNLEFDVSHYFDYGNETYDVDVDYKYHIEDDSVDSDDSEVEDVNDY